MAKNTGAVIERIAKVLGMVEEGIYNVTADGNLYKGEKLIKGSIGSEDGQRWYNVKGMSVQGQRLMYAYFNGGADALDNNKVVKHLDDNKLNNAGTNLVQVNKSGWKAELDALRLANGIVIGEEPAQPVTVAPVKPVTVEAPQVEVVAPVEVAPEVVVAPAPVAPTQEGTLDRTKLTEKQMEAVIIWEALLEGMTIKEVAEKLNVKASRVYDVKRGKSNADVTSQLPQLA